jgi:hypothetical protein
MNTDDLRQDAVVLEAMIQGIHTARVNHRILSMFATRSDSAMLACAAMDALQTLGFEIVRREGAAD